MFKSAWIESGSRVEDGGDFYLKTPEWVLIRRKKVSMKEWNYCPGKFYWSFVAISLNCRQIWTKRTLHNLSESLGFLLVIHGENSSWGGIFPQPYKVIVLFADKRSLSPPFFLFGNSYVVDFFPSEEKFLFLGRFIPKF